MRRYRIEDKEFSEINITPFTDIILVLLMIFMVASPFLVVGAFKVKLPAASTSEPIQGKNIEIYLDSSNKLYMNDKNMTMPELLIQVQLELQKNPEKTVVIKADKNVFHGNFISLLDKLKQDGVTKFLIGTAKTE